MIHDLPTIPERAATGSVRAVYAEIRQELPFVPLIFQALAIQPIALGLAWQQARAVLRADDYATALAEIGREATAAAPTLPFDLSELTMARQVALNSIVRFFANLSRADALISAQLALALAGQVEAKPATFKPAPSSRRRLPEPELDLIDPEAAPPVVAHRFRQVRALLGTPHVPSLWRVLASDPILLDVVWEQLHTSLPRAHFAARETELVQALRHQALSLQPTVVCSVEALEMAKIGETVPAIKRMVGVFAASTLRQLLISHSLDKSVPAGEHEVSIA